MSFTVVPFEDIDIVKWNSCIHYAANGNVFGYHWFLKNTIKEWDAIVYKDYEAVMAIPSPFRKNGKSNEIKTPEYLRELGLFSTSLLNSQRVEKALSYFPKKADSIRIAMNLGNPLSELDGLTVKYKKNHTISLYDDYESVRKKYSQSFVERENINDLGWYLDTQIKPEELVEYIFMKKQQDWDRYTALRIVYNALHRGIGLISVLKDRNKNLLAAGFFIYSHGRIIHMFSSSYSKAETDPELYLLDALIQTHAGRPLIFDLNMDENSITAALGAESYEYPILLKEKTKANWLVALRGYFQ